MSDMQFEHIRQTLLETQEFEYHPEDWQAVDKVLRPPRKKRRFLWLFFTVLGLLLSIGLVSQLLNVPVFPKASRMSISGGLNVAESEQNPVIVEKSINEKSTQLTQETIETENPSRVIQKIKPENQIHKPKPAISANEPIPQKMATPYQLTTEKNNPTESPREKGVLSDGLYPSIQAPVFLPVKSFRAEGITNHPEQLEAKNPGTLLTKKKKALHGRIAFGLNLPIGDNTDFPGNYRTPVAVGQSLQLMLDINEKTAFGAKLRHQRSYSYQDSTSVQTANQWYPDWSNEFETYYDSLDIAQNSLTLDLSLYRTLVNRPGIKVRLGLGTRLALKKGQRVDTVIKNVYLGRLTESHELTFPQLFHGITPELQIDLPVYNKIGLSLGVEYMIPVNAFKPEIESPLSGFARLYYDF